MNFGRYFYIALYNNINVGRYSLPDSREVSVCLEDVFSLLCMRSA